MSCPICKVCGGTGYHEVFINEWDLDDRECLECNGTGEVEEEEE